MHTLELIDAKLPKLETLIELNKEKADRGLTDIQNGIVTKVKSEQIHQKKAAKKDLDELIRKLGQLNNALEQTNDEETRNRTLEAREAFQSKYNNHFRREAEKTTLFRQMNFEKPTKCFLNLASDQKTMESPSNKLKKNGRKYDNMEDVLNDTHDFYANTS